MWSWLLTAICLAGPEVHEVVRHVDAPVEDVFAALSEAERWAVLLEVDPTGTRHHVRAAADEPGTLLWSSGTRERGTLAYTGLVPAQSVAYEVSWAQPGLTTPSPPAHRGELVLEADGEGTTVRWRVERDPRRGDKVAGVSRRLEADLERAADRLSTAVQAPAAPAPSVVRNDQVVLWNGFHHRWTYNHRINRSGDGWTASCEGGDCSARWFHAAASGSGADRATFDGAATVLTGEGVYALEGEATLWLDGREGESLTDRACVQLPQGTPDGPAVLRGYDLDAVEAADSLWELELSVERADDWVCAVGRVKMACRTPECGTEALTTYRLRIPWSVVVGPELAVHTASVTQDHSWKADDLRDEPDPAGHRLTRSLPADPDRPHAIGLSAVSVALEGPLHTRGLDLALTPTGRDGDQAGLDLDLFYVQWGPVEMAPLTVAQFAHAGRAVLRADLVGIQPAAGCVEHVTAEGELYWPGKQADASVPSAVFERSVGLQGCGGR